MKEYKNEENVNTKIFVVCLLRSNVMLTAEQVYQQRYVIGDIREMG